MKKALAFLTALLITTIIGAQSPNKMSYQAVIRLNTGQLITNQQIGMQVSIVQGSETGATVYVETHAPSTNANGLVSVEIGNGTVINGNYASIDWSTGIFYVKTEIDPAENGTNYTIASTSQLLTVPFALHANSAESFTGELNETDPVFDSSAASNISEADIVRWNSKSDTLGFATNSTNTIDIQSNKEAVLNNFNAIALKEDVINKSTDVTLSANSDVLYPSQKAVKTYVDAFTISDSTLLSHPSFGINDTKIANWDTAFNWGNHASANYLTSFTETDPVFSNHPTFEITNEDITKWKANFLWYTSNANNYLGIASPAGGITAADTTKWNKSSGDNDTITNGSVTYNKIQNLSSDKLLGRSTAGAGIVEEISLTAAGRALIDDIDVTAQKTTLGLNNVDNTSDASKPVSTAAQTALDLKANLASPIFSGTPALPTGTVATTQTAGNNTTALATTAFVSAALMADTTADATTIIKGKVKLAGDLTGTADLPIVATIGGSTAANVNAATVLANAATHANTANTIIKRDASGNFIAGTITANLTGNVSGTSTNVTGTVTIANGGTGATVKVAAFDALSPLSTQGDILYAGASGVDTRLAKGTASQVLTMNSGAIAPEWATPSAVPLTTDALTEGTANLYYTEARVSANTNVAANTNKVGITSGQASEITANTSKVTNVSTALSTGTVNTTSYGITSDGGANDIVLVEATTSTAGLLGADKWDEIVVNTAKVSYKEALVSANTNVAANTNKVGITSGQASEITANTSKVTNVSTALSTGTVNTTSYGITSDGGANDIVLVEATTSTAGLLGADKWDEIVANTAKVSYTDAAAVALNTAKDGYTEARVSANTNVAANTNKVGITSGQASEITANNAKVSYTDAAAVALNTAKNTNVSTALSTGTVNTTSYGITSDGGANDIVLVEATTSTAGLLGADKWDEIVANTAKVSYTDAAAVVLNTAKDGYTEARVSANTNVAANTNKVGITSGQASEITANTSKVTNVSTALSTGTVNTTSYGITSDGGANDIVLVEATTSTAGLLGADKWDEIVVNTAKVGYKEALVSANTNVAANTNKVGITSGQASEITANTSKVTNVSTALSTGTVNTTSYGITSDGGGNDIILVEATTSTAGLLGADKWDEIVANTAKVSYTDAAAVALNTSKLTGAVAIANGGTGATTKVAAFDALSPLSTQGDILYAGASGADTRLAKGTASQVLTMNSSATAPEWTTASSGGVTYKQGGANFNGSLLLGHETTGTLDNANYNTGVGTGTLKHITSGDGNTASGYSSLEYNTTGGYNTATGLASLFTNTAGDYNTATGISSLRLNTAGNYNTTTGAFSLYNNTTGNYNTAIGSRAGLNITSGSNNIAIGNGAQVASATADNQIRLGNYDIQNAYINVAWTTSSDRRLKSNIKNSAFGLDFVSKLRPVEYTRKNDDSQKLEYGFIAQELEEVLNTFGVENTGMFNIDDEGMYSIRYNDLFAPLVKATQEQQVIIDAEKAKNDEQQTIIESQQKQIDELKKLVEQLLAK